MSRYAKFYWPLALSGMALLLEHQFQNAVLARYANADVELATFALANSSFQLVNALLIFVPQMVVVLARTQADRFRCLRFVNVAGLLLCLPLLGMGFSVTGGALLGRLMNIPPPVLPSVVRYLQWLAPLVWVNAVRHYFTGILVLNERTRTVTLLNVAHLVVLVGVLLGGYQAGWDSLPTLALGTISANVLHFLLGLVIVRKIPGSGTRSTETVPLNYTGIFRFFWPMATTSMLFALSRPVLYAYVNLTEQAVLTVAALRVGFDFGMMFQNPVNQFRHVYATFGAEDPKGVARFMYRVTAGLIAGMAIMVYTPFSRLIFEHVMGLKGDVLIAGRQTVSVLLLVPAIIMLRNLYHGKMMIRRNTAGMAVAALLRVGAIAVASKLLQMHGLLNHVTGAMVIMLGFLFEAFMARQVTRRPKRKRPNRGITTIGLARDAHLPKP